MDKVKQIVIEPHERYLQITALTKNGRIWTGTTRGTPQTGEQTINQNGQYNMSWIEVQPPPDCTTN